LPEGFTTTQKVLFNRIARVMVDQLFDSNLHSPFNLLKDRINVWTAFDPSMEEGITPGSIVSKDLPLTLTRKSKPGYAIHAANVSPNTQGNPNLQQLIRTVGLPDSYFPIPTDAAGAKAAWATIGLPNAFANTVEDEVLLNWLAFREYHLMQAKDSRFGLINGSRYGDQESHTVETTMDVRRWYAGTTASRFPSNDRRRMSRGWHFAVDTLLPYLASLRVNPVKHDSTTFADIADLWGRNGQDRKLVVFIVNSDFGGGLHQPGGGVRASVRTKKRYTTLIVDGRKSDHIPKEILPLHAFSWLAGTDIDAATSVLAHELGHALLLRDEYENQRWGVRHNELLESDKLNQRIADRFHNIIQFFRIRNTSGGSKLIDMSLVKWKQWIRMEQSSVLTENASAIGGGQFRFRVARGERPKWGFAIASNADVFLRTRDINPYDDKPNEDSEKVFAIEGPYKIQGFTEDGQVTLSGSMQHSFQSGDVFYLPETEGGTPLTVFHPAVLRHLETTGKPFGLKSDTSKANDGASYPDPINDPTFNPRDLAFVIGIYDGGGTFNSRVYRPSGMCKMRVSSYGIVREKQDVLSDDLEFEFSMTVDVRKLMPYCYVCQYALANEIDPSTLSLLAYPQ
jgi:hypothetical protein